MLEYYRHRAGLIDAEHPVAQEMKDSAMIRMKGSLRIIYLAELIGQERLEEVLAEFLLNWRFKPAPYPTADDLVTHLKVRFPDASDQIDDLFNEVLNWRNSVQHATAIPLESGRWQVHVTVDARKFRTTGQRKETEVPLATALPITIFGDGGTASEDVIFQDIYDLQSGLNEITLTIDRRPSTVAVDGMLWLPDPQSDDNVAPITILDDQGG